MNTFFISPLIPFSYYIMIQKEKNNPIFNWNEQEIKVLKNINMVFNYDKILSDDDKYIIIDISNKISSEIPEYNKFNNNINFYYQSIYTEITNYNFVYYHLLKSRNYEQIINPYSVDKINLCIGLSDIGPSKEKFTTTFNTYKTDEEKFNYINKLINSKDNNVKTISHDIMGKSIIDSKINTITKILSDKSLLYNILDGEDFIPISNEVEINRGDENILKKIDYFKKNIKSDIFVLKPAGGTASDGVGVFNIKELDLNMVKTWTSNPDNNKFSGNQNYTLWILSEFVQSFLWKLQGQNKTSIFFQDLAKKIPEFTFNFNDKIGRINKARFWGLYTIINDEFTSYLYKNASCDIAIEELTDYSPLQVNPESSEIFYENLLNSKEDKRLFSKIIKNGPKNLEEEKIEAITVGSYLDFARILNEKSYPMGSEAWNNIVLPNMYKILNVVSYKLKKYINCMNCFKNNGLSKGCFSFFALDILIDENSKPWLLEINTRPYTGFDYDFKKYDPNNNYVLNVYDVFNGVLGLTTDIVNGSGHPNVNYEDFLVTHIDKLNDTPNKRKLYVPLSLGITQSATSRVYNEIYNILDKNNYSSFPYPRQMGNAVTRSIGFRGMSAISKFLISKIAELGNDKFLSLMRDLFPYDAKMKLLNRISTLGFYLGDKAEMTKILKSKVKDWDTIIPYSETLDISLLTDNEIIEIINNSPIANDTLIAKPAYGQQGKGIIISNNVQTLVAEMRQNTEEKDFVISKYLDDPYLIKLNKEGVSDVTYNDTSGRKCHLRAYVLVHSKANKDSNGSNGSNGNSLNVYLYNESLIFCAAKEYNSCSEEDKQFCNLTNLYYGSKYYKDILNKNPGDAYKDLSGLARDLIPPSEYPQLMERIKHIIKTTILAVKDDLLCLNNNDCYQYIAFDLHLEKSPNNSSVPIPWLLEVNATPGLKSPDYQWQSIGGLQNFLESILNITIKTKMSKNGKQLFEYLPFNKKPIEFDKFDLPFKHYRNKKDYSCTDNKYKDIKKALQLLNIPGRSYLTTKQTMCEGLCKVQIKS